MSTDFIREGCARRSRTRGAITMWSRLRKASSSERSLAKSRPSAHGGWRRRGACLASTPMEQSRSAAPKRGHRGRRRSFCDGCVRGVRRTLNVSQLARPGSGGNLLCFRLVTCVSLYHNKVQSDFMNKVKNHLVSLARGGGRCRAACQTGTSLSESRPSITVVSLGVGCAGVGRGAGDGEIYGLSCPLLAAWGERRTRFRPVRRDRPAHFAPRQRRAACGSRGCGKNVNRRKSQPVADPGFGRGDAGVGVQGRPLHT